jgi:hypothetical protein
MNTFNKKTWKWALALAGVAAAVAASGALDDPAPDALVPPPMWNGYPAIRPPINMGDLFKAPR